MRKNHDINWKKWLCVCVGIIVGPVLLSVWQGLEITVHYLLTYPQNDIPALDVFRQYAAFNGHYAFYAIGSILGGLSGALLAAWNQRNAVSIRRVVAIGTLVSLVLSCVTIFNEDFMSGIGYVGAPVTAGLWAARVFYNATALWSLAFIIAGGTAIRELTRK